jgi:hypothetical protein
MDCMIDQTTLARQQGVAARCRTGENLCFDARFRLPIWLWFFGSSSYISNWPAAGFVDAEFGCSMKPEVANAVTSNVRVKINHCHPMPIEVDLLLSDLSKARHQLDWGHSTPPL